MNGGKKAVLAALLMLFLVSGNAFSQDACLALEQTRITLTNDPVQGTTVNAKAYLYNEKFEAGAPGTLPVQKITKIERGKMVVVKNDDSVVCVGATDANGELAFSATIDTKQSTSLRTVFCPFDDNKNVSICARIEESKIAGALQCGTASPDNALGTKYYPSEAETLIAPDPTAGQAQFCFLATVIIGLLVAAQMAVGKNPLAGLDMSSRPVRARMSTGYSMRTRNVSVSVAPILNTLDQAIDQAVAGSESDEEGEGEAYETGKTDENGKKVLTADASQAKLDGKGQPVKAKDANGKQIMTKGKTYNTQDGKPTMDSSKAAKTTDSEGKVNLAKRTEKRGFSGQGFFGRLISSGTNAATGALGKAIGGGVSSLGLGDTLSKGLTVGLTETAKLAATSSFSNLVRMGVRGGFKGMKLKNLPSALNPKLNAFDAIQIGLSVGETVGKDLVKKSDEEAALKARLNTTEEGKALWAKYESLRDERKKTSNSSDDAKDLADLKYKMAVLLLNDYDKAKNTTKDAGADLRGAINDRAAYLKNYIAQANRSDSTVGDKKKELASLEGMLKDLDAGKMPKASDLATSPINNRIAAFSAASGKEAALLKRIGDEKPESTILMSKNVALNNIANLEQQNRILQKQIDSSDNEALKNILRKKQDENNESIATLKQQSNEIGQMGLKVEAPHAMRVLQAEDGAAGVRIAVDGKVYEVAKNEKGESQLFAVNSDGSRGEQASGIKISIGEKTFEFAVGGEGNGAVFALKEDGTRGAMASLDALKEQMPGAQLLGNLDNLAQTQSQIAEIQKSYQNNAMLLPSMQDPQQFQQLNANMQEQLTEVAALKGSQSEIIQGCAPQGDSPTAALQQTQNFDASLSLQESRVGDMGNALESRREIILSKEGVEINAERMKLENENIRRTMNELDDQAERNGVITQYRNTTFGQYADIYSAVENYQKAPSEDNRKILVKEFAEHFPAGDKGFEPKAEENPYAAMMEVAKRGTASGNSETMRYVSNAILATGGDEGAKNEMKAIAEKNTAFGTYEFAKSEASAASSRMPTERERVADEAHTKADTIQYGGRSIFGDGYNIGVALSGENYRSITQRQAENYEAYAPYGAGIELGKELLSEVVDALRKEHNKERAGSSPPYKDVSILGDKWANAIANMAVEQYLGQIRQETKQKDPGMMAWYETQRRMGRM